MPSFYSRPDDTEPWPSLPNVETNYRDRSDILEDQYEDTPLTRGQMIQLQEALQERIDNNQRDEEDEDYDDGTGYIDVMTGIGYVTLWFDGKVIQYGHKIAHVDLDTDYAAEAVGWYICSCLPGCLPDSDWLGPYETEELACADYASTFDVELSATGRDE